FIASGGSTAYANGCLPNTNFTVPTMCPFWDDLYKTDAANGNGIFTSVTGSAPSRAFNIERRTTFCCTCGTPLNNFEIRLYENSGGFDFVYGAVADRASATIGVQQTSTGPFTQFECNTAQSLAGVQLHFDCGMGACCLVDGSCSVV